MSVEDRPHYAPEEQYVTLERWTSYWFQVQAVLRTGAETMLEVGIGPRMVARYLEEFHGVRVTTFDANPSLEPDVTGDVKELASHFEPGSFECVCAFQVLEHMPYSEFQGCVEQLARVSARHVIISLPHWGYALNARIRIKNLRLALGRKMTFGRPFTLPPSLSHKWEIGTKGHPLKRITRDLSKHLEIKKRYFCPDNPYHYFFECVKR